MSRLTQTIRRWQTGLILILTAVAAVVLIRLIVVLTPTLRPGSTDSDAWKVDSIKLKAIEQALGTESGTSPGNAVLCFDFDPNTADSLTLLKLGLRPYQAHNCLQYVRRGGRWRNAEHFGQLYGLDKAQYERLRPYIKIGLSPEEMLRQRQQAERRAERASRQHYYDSIRALTPPKLAAGMTIDLNEADTLQLRKIPGIGSYYARKIAAYRQRLGGFVTLSQVYEVEGIPPGIDKYLHLSPSAAAQVATIHLNKADFKQLVRHPYLNYEQTKVIMNYIRKHGSLRSWRDVILSPHFSPSDTLRLSPYIRFN